MTAAVLGLSVSFLLGFTTTVPARHPDPITTTRANVYVHDPYVSNLFGNVTGKVPPSDCTASQAIGIYDDGGSIGINCLSSMSSTSTTTTTTPSTPAAGSVTSYYLGFDGGFPAIPFTVDGVFGIGIPVGAIGSFFTNFGTASNWFTSCHRLGNFNSTVIHSYNGPAPLQNGGGTGMVWATTNFTTRNMRFENSAGAGINISAGIRQAIDVAWMGDGAGRGGWIFWTRVLINMSLAGQRFAVGLFDQTSLLTSTTDPNTATDSVYFGCNSGDTNLSICSNDNIGTATCTTLGASYPCTTVGAFYDFWLAAAPNASSVSYFIERLDSAASTGASVTGDLPRNVVQLSWQNWINTGPTTSGVARIQFTGACLASNL